MTCDNDHLHRDLLKAHAALDAPALAALYQAAARGADDTGDKARACFFLTQAWVFALEAGLPKAEDLHAELASYGRVT